MPCARRDAAALHTQLLDASRILGSQTADQTRTTQVRRALEGMLRRRVSAPVPVASAAHHEADPDCVELSFLAALTDALKNEHVHFKH